MDACEATNILISKIKKIDPENAPKIMGYILLQGLSDAGLTRLASSPDVLLRNVVLKVKAHLGMSVTSSSAPPSNPSSPSPLNPISRPANPFSQTSPRVPGSDPFSDFTRISSSNSWPLPGLATSLGTSGNTAAVSPKASPFLSYDNIRSGSMVVPPLFKTSGSNPGYTGGEVSDEYRLDDYLSFLDESSSKMDDQTVLKKQTSGFEIDDGDTHFHRRRFSESDVSLRGEEGAFPVGYRPCMYYARGFCKNGDSCKFTHIGCAGDDGFDGAICVNGSFVGPPREMESVYMKQHEDMLRVKAAQLHNHQILTHEKYVNFLLHQREDPHRLGSAPSTTADEFQKLSRFRQERSECFAMGLGEKSNSAARQIYLTFPADSAFRDEDVSNYFSTFGPVQDVRIPYQQKRMFGFVTFVHHETVKLILARGNPHFICESRVLVKPYKEKGKLINEFNRRQHHLQQQLLERGNLSPCSCPSRVDSNELYDLHLEARMIQDAQELMLRRKLEEQVELQQAIELQGRRLVNLQLPETRPVYSHHQFRNSSLQAQTLMSDETAMKTNNKTHDFSNGDCTRSGVISTDAGNHEIQPDVISNCKWKVGVTAGKVDTYGSECFGAQERYLSTSEHTLPDTLFSSPQSSVELQPELLTALTGAKKLSLISSFNSSLASKETMTTNSADDMANN